MEMKARLKKIDDFFKGMSVEEFDIRLEKAGINDITSSSDEDMELLSSLEHTVYHNYELTYTNDNDKERSDFNPFSKDYLKAV